MSKRKENIPQQKPVFSPQSNAGKLITWQVVLLALILLLVVSVRLRLLSLPLERDEGEYAYIGQLLLKGYAPFELAYNMKFPGTSMMYALIMSVFGQSAEGIHAGLLLVSLGTILLMFLAVRRFMGPAIAVFASASYALLTLSPAVLGSAAHATHFVMLFAVAGIFQLLVALERRSVTRLAVSGLLLGLSIVMKQSGIFFAAFGGLVFLYHQVFIIRSRWSVWIMHAVLFAGVISLPVALLFFWMYEAGTFNRFWFWTFEYGSQYAGTENLSTGFANLLASIDGLQRDFMILWLVAPAGMFLLWSGNYRYLVQLFITVFAVVSVASVCPGLYFRQHYFVMLMPVFSILASMAIHATGVYIGGKLQVLGITGTSVLVFLIACLAGVIPLRWYLFEQNMFAVSRSIYGSNPFPESVAIGRYIKNNTSVTDRVAILGSEPQIYFYADRLCATGYIYTYSLMEEQIYSQRMHDEIIAEIESSKPEMLVFCRHPLSWLVRQNSHLKVLQWINDYSKVHYDVAGIMEIPTDYGPGEFYWNDELNHFRGTSDRQIYIFKRKKEGN